ncbi:hypothetical protein JZU68_07815, partial [bacterium]|nr:hypothetical protein [bacterium]
DLWLLTQSINTDLEPKNSNTVWTKINQSINSTNQVVKRYSRTFSIKYISVAASLAFILGIGLSYLLNPTIAQNHTTVIAPRGQKAQVELPDGT